MTDSEPVTLVYKRLAATGLPIHIDVYPPSPAAASHPHTSDAPPRLRLPAVVYFHGGGLTVGNRKSWFPAWLHKRVTAAGCAFVSADYQLLPPATAYDIVCDISDLLEYLVADGFGKDEPEGGGTVGEDEVTLREDGTSSSSAGRPPLQFTIDPNAIAVAGSSAGGLCAYLAAMHCTSPKPRAILSLYGMGGNFLTPHYLHPKTGPFFLADDMLDPADPVFAPFLHPTYTAPPVSDAPLVYHGPEHATPGYPAHPRMLLTRLFLQLGLYLDYYTGVQGLSAGLRDTIEEGEEKGDVERLLVQSGALALFPQFSVRAGAGGWPPTVFCHGTGDSSVSVDESRHLAGLLRRAGVEVEVREFEGEEHGFDSAPGAEERYASVFDEVWGFLVRRLGTRRGRE